MAVKKKKAAKKKRKAASKKHQEQVDEYGLTLKEREVADLYRADPEVKGNAKRSYWRAFPRSSESTAEVEGSKLIKRPHVVAYLKAKSDELMEKADFSEERILRELSYLAYLDPADFYDESGNLLPVNDMPEHARRALGSIEVTEEFEGRGKNREMIGYTKKVKAIDKKGSLELAMKHKGMLKADKSPLDGLVDPIKLWMDKMNGTTGPTNKE